MAIKEVLTKALKRNSPKSKLWLSPKGPHIGLYCQSRKKLKWLMWVSKTQATELEQMGVDYKEGKQHE